MAMAHASLSNGRGYYARVSERSDKIVIYVIKWGIFGGEKTPENGKVWSIARASSTGHLVLTHV